MFEKILLCSDGSDTALRAAEAAAALAKRLGVELTVLHVAQAPAMLPSSLTMLPASTSPMIIAELLEVDHESARVPTVAVLEEAGVGFNFVETSGDVADAILHCAKEGGFDLIVLGSRGLGAVKSFFLGSVSSRVTQHAPCAVLIVKQPASAAGEPVGRADVSAPMLEPQGERREVAH